MLVSNGRLGFHGYGLEGRFQVPFANIRREQEIDRQAFELRGVLASFLAKYIHRQYLRCGCGARPSSGKQMLSIRYWIGRLRGGADRRVYEVALANMFYAVQVCELTDRVIELL